MATVSELDIEAEMDAIYAARHAGAEPDRDGRRDDAPPSRYELDEDPRSAEDPDEPVLLDAEGAAAGLERIAQLPRYSTPFSTLNSSLGLGGLVASQSVIVAGGTGVGKTTFAAQLASHHAEHHGWALYGSFELPTGILAARIAAPRLGVPSNAFFQGQLSRAQIASAIHPRMLFLERTTLKGLRTAIDRLAQKHGSAPLVVIDYLQLLADQVMHDHVRRGHAAEPRIAAAAVSGALRGIARDFQAPLVILSATSRIAGSRLRGVGKLDVRRLRPTELVDVARESSAIEYDASAVLALSLEEYLGPTELQVGTLSTAKSRFGHTCHIDMSYDGAGARWTDRGLVQREARATEPRQDPAAVRLAEIEALKADVLSMLRACSLSRTELTKRLGRRADDVREVVNKLVADGHAVEVGRGSRTRIGVASAVQGQDAESKN